MKLFYLSLLLIVVAFATGCPKTRTPMPAPLKQQLINNRVGRLVTLATNYDEAIDDGGTDNLAKAKIYRNELIYQLMQLIDDNYNQFENDLFVGRATADFAGDFLELGIATATGITNGERVKTILGIALTAIKGTRESINTRYFRERTTELIAMKMRASRAKVLQTIHQGVALEVGEYPLGAGLDDLISYLHAGSLNAAFLELAQDTGADAKVARAEAADLKIHPFLTKGQAATLDTVDTLRERIILAASSGSEATKTTIATELRTMLPKIGYTAEQVEAASGLNDLLQLLQTKIREATRARDGELLTTIQTELKGLSDKLPQ